MIGAKSEESNGGSRLRRCAMGTAVGLLQTELHGIWCHLVGVCRASYVQVIASEDGARLRVWGLGSRTDSQYFDWGLSQMFPSTCKPAPLGPLNSLSVTGGNLEAATSLSWFCHTSDKVGTLVPTGP